MQARPYFGRYAMVPAPTYAAAPAYAVYAAPAVYYYNVPATRAPAVTNGRSDRDSFYAQLHAFRASIGQPISRLPTLGFKELDLWTLYREVTRRRGIDAVIARKQWKEVAEALRLPSSCTDSGFRLRLHYKKYLEAFERKFFTVPPMSSSAPPPVPVASPPRPQNRRKKRRSPPTPLLQLPPAPNLAEEDANAASALAALVNPRNVPASASTLCSVAASSEHRALKPTATVAPAPTNAPVDPPTSPMGSCDSEAHEVDFSLLAAPSLKRYASAFGIQRDACELVDAVSAHFRSRPEIDAQSEHLAIAEFMCAVRKRRKRSEAPQPHAD